MCERKIFFFQILMKINGSTKSDERCGFGTNVLFHDGAQLGILVLIRKIHYTYQVGNEHDEDSILKRILVNFHRVAFNSSVTGNQCQCCKCCR